MDWFSSESRLKFFKSIWDFYVTRCVNTVTLVPGLTGTRTMDRKTVDHVLDFQKGVGLKLLISQAAHLK